MDENTREQITRVMSGLRALRKSTERALRFNQTAGTRSIVLRTYENLHKQLRSIMPDDVYVESQAMEITEDMNDEAAISQAQFLADQLYTYLRDTVSEAGRDAKGFSFSFGDFDAPNFPFEGDRLRNLGREIQDQVMGMTRHTLRRAISNLDVEFESGGDYRNAYLQQQDFSNKNLSGADFRHAVLLDCQLDTANLQNADLRKTHIRDNTLTGANLHGSDLRKLVLIDSQLTGANLGRADMRAAMLYDCDLTGANLGRTNLDRVHFVNCTLKGANLHEASTDSVILHNVDLEGAIMPNGQPYRAGMNLRQFDIEVANGAIPPRPPVPPAPPEAPEAPDWQGRSKRGPRVKISFDKRKNDEIEEELDAVEDEIDQAKNEAREAAHELAQHARLEAKRAALEARRQALEAQMLDLERSMQEIDEDEE